VISSMATTTSERSTDVGHWPGKASGSLVEVWPANRGIPTPALSTKLDVPEGRTPGGSQPISAEADPRRSASEAWESGLVRRREPAIRQKT
jgi:hypothetical protein